MEQESNVLNVRTHRVGSITAGICMVFFGVMMLLHTVMDLMSYQIIFSLWPVILVGMGAEILLSNCGKKKIIYDKAAVFLLIMMTFLTIGLACADVCMEASWEYLNNM